MKLGIPLYTAAALALTCSSCKLLIPSHRNSNWRDGERVTIQMVDYNDVNQGDAFGIAFTNNYRAAFKELPGQHRQPKSAIAAPIAAAAAGFVMDYVSKSLGEEAKLYESQFGDTLADSRFFQVQDRKRVFNYYGIVVKRDLVDSKGRVENAYTLVCGIAPIADERLMIMKPLSFATKKSKAKIVGNGPCSYLAVYPWLFKRPGNQINSTIDFKIDGYFKDKDQYMKVIPMGAFSFKFPAYNLSSPVELTAASANSTTRIPDQVSGFLDTAPLSLETDGKPALDTSFTGAFSVKATVTESDTSNAKENIQKLGELISKQKDNVTGFITNSIPAGQ